jgi:AbrB family looped-hinge helix DNA binding protein
MQVLGDSKLSRKYQVTVPKNARRLLELDAGDMLIFATENGELLIRRGKLLIEERRRSET